MSQANKRKASDDTNRADAKRHEATLNNIGDEFVCPITTELPLDPVTARDGRIYERSAIEEHIERQGDVLRSPATNEPMGPELLDAIQVRNMIEQLVKSGALAGDKAWRWEERVRDEMYITWLKENAENGDPNAMFRLGHVFYEGFCGQKQDKAKGFEWYRKAADKNYPPAMALAGNNLTLGAGVAQNVGEGILLIGRAAEQGSPVAAYILGVWYTRGHHGLPKTTDQAKEWLRKAISGSSEFAWSIGEETKSKARDMLNELSGESEIAAARSNA